MKQRILGQRYELQSLIGHGGMADVYKAQDVLLDRPVAVKILHEEFRRDKEFIEKFHREAQAAARLSHPNIVNIYDVGMDEDEHYIVMEYVPGDTLKTLIKEKGRLSMEEALRIAREVAEALCSAHQSNLVHCDIKPHNILMMADGHAKIADFGIARAVTESTMTYGGNVVGSVHYFSPEQAKGTYVTPKSDVYSLGVVLYEMLTGQLPFTGENPVSIAMKHLQEEAVSVRQLRQEIPPLVEAIVMKAMSKDSAMRPNSEEFSKSLLQAERMLHGGLPLVQKDPYATQILPRVKDNTTLQISKPREVQKDDSDEHTSLFKSKVFVAVLLMVLGMGFCVGAFLSFGKFWSTEEVEIPNVVGKQMTLARQILEDKHLRVNIAETYDAAVPAGQVVSQTPEAGAKVKAERLVTIYVSKGGEDLEMPDLKGLLRADAEAKLKKLGLNIGEVTEKPSDSEPGIVLSTNPYGGTKINKGAIVDIIVSVGKKPKKHSVPNVTGLTSEDAKEKLSAAGFVVGSISKKPSKQAAGTVVSQSPSSGDLEEGASVSLVIAEPEAEKPVERQQAANNTAKQENTGGEVKVPTKNAETGKSK